ncbi:uncharacterized protein LAJ45_10671 [Morchella importuna]|uniref:Uncharacterized protein n=1 Tax=Morchella conica CCBAS932 TaxID=1392247 RepID=A0A3N4L3L2_9PEZI|nr:uncharacterized protein LAJ45_10671 [Morchella importuna]KAH8145388.1 hypothetical protein LAJ45_10671 [Morchella importuna]RPB17413.1 hypothetical protein P167DRAFT_551038 [Morchella conica CCBAS932]
MLEYFTWKKIKAHKEAAASATASTSTAAETVPAGPQEVLSNSDEAFLRQQLEGADEPVVILSGGGDSGSTTPGASPLPPATPAPTPIEGRSATTTGEWSAVGLKNRFGELRRAVSSAAERRKKGKTPVDVKGKGKEPETLKVEKPVAEGVREEDELTAALEGLNLAAENGRVFSMSTETKILLDKFILILKDISNGAPTAYQDLIDLFDNSSKTFEDTFSTLPSFLQKIIKTLPKKMQAKMAPELLRTAAAVSPAAAAEAEALGGMFTLKELVTKPGLLMGMLKSVMNFLKLRFPAALGGTSLAMSMGLFVVLFVLWYCYKRGREVRLEAEASAAAAELLDGVEGGGIEGSSSAPQVIVGDSTRKTA